MSLKAEEKAVLKALCGKRSKAELKRVFALVRANSDRALLAALAPPKPRKKARDTLAADVAKALSALLAPASEKAEMLVEHLARRHKRKLALSPKGLAAATRALRAHFSDAEIRAAATSLMKELAARYDARETVV